MKVSRGDAVTISVLLRVTLDFHSPVVVLRPWRLEETQTGAITGFHSEACSNDREWSWCDNTKLPSVMEKLHILLRKWFSGISDCSFSNKSWREKVQTGYIQVAHSRNRICFIRHVFAVNGCCRGGPVCRLSLGM